MTGEGIGDNVILAETEGGGHLREASLPVWLILRWWAMMRGWEGMDLGWVQSNASNVIFGVDYCMPPRRPQFEPKR